MALRSIKESTNYNGKIFVNPIPTKLFQSGSVWSTFTEMMMDQKKREPSIKPGPFPVDSLALKNMKLNELSLLWLGHSIILFSIEGKVFLTDPVWAKRASPVSFGGPKRFFDAPIDLEALPRLDGILLSHDHYDHLDAKTILKLSNQEIHIYCPIGVGNLLSKWGVLENLIHEFDWWEELILDSGVKLAATPARHFSGRSILNRNQTLWTSWVIKGKNKTVFYGGDSGYFPGFKEIGNKYGPFDISMLEIGAYHPNWGSIHMGPVNAMNAQIDLNSKCMLPIHWGLFNLALHGWKEPVEEIIQLAEKNQVKLCLPVPGELISQENFGQISYWWRKY